MVDKERTYPPIRQRYSFSFEYFAISSLGLAITSVGSLGGLYSRPQPMARNTRFKPAVIRIAVPKPRVGIVALKGKERVMIRSFD